MDEYENLYRGLLIADWIALVVTAFVGGAIAIAAARAGSALSRRGLRFIAGVTIAVCSVVMLPLLYGAYYLAETAAVRVAVAAGSVELLKSDGDFAATRAKLMLLADGLDLWPPAYPGWVVRILLPLCSFAVMAFAVWRSLKGKRGMDLLRETSELARRTATGHLIRIDDDDLEHRYAVSRAEYAVYKDGDLWWLTLVVRAERKLAPEDDSNPEPLLEVNIPLDTVPSAVLRPGNKVPVAGYSERFSNLAMMYSWSHQTFDGEVIIETGDEDGFTAVIHGYADDDPVCVRAAFRANPRLRRSFV